MCATHASQRYFNVMEMLVTREVDRQYKQLPAHLTRYLQKSEVVTYALNRLPALYASSEQGWQQQYRKGEQELQQQIVKAVQQGFAAVQVDPIRQSKPLVLPGEQDAQSALESIRELLKQPDLSWDGVVRRMQQMLRVDARSRQQVPSIPPTVRASATLSGNGTWTPREARYPTYAWENPLYRQ